MGILEAFKECRRLWRAALERCASEREESSASCAPRVIEKLHLSGAGPAGLGSDGARRHDRQQKGRLRSASSTARSSVRLVHLLMRGPSASPFMTSEAARH
jgi:hypothetical protein